MKWSDTTPSWPVRRGFVSALPRLWPKMRRWWSFLCFCKEWIDNPKLWNYSMIIYWYIYIYILYTYSYASYVMNKKWSMNGWYGYHSQMGGLWQCCSHMKWLINVAIRMNNGLSLEAHCVSMFSRIINVFHEIICLSSYIYICNE